MNDKLLNFLLGSIFAAVLLTAYILVNKMDLIMRAQIQQITRLESFLSSFAIPMDDLPKGKK